MLTSSYSSSSLRFLTFSLTNDSTPLSMKRTSTTGLPSRSVLYCWKSSSEVLRSSIDRMPWQRSWFQSYDRSTESSKQIGTRLWRIPCSSSRECSCWRVDRPKRPARRRSDRGCSRQCLSSSARRSPSRFRDPYSSSTTHKAHFNGVLGCEISLYPSQRNHKRNGRKHMAHRHPNTHLLCHGLVDRLHHLLLHHRFFLSERETERCTPTSTPPMCRFA